MSSSMVPSVLRNGIKLGTEASFSKPSIFLPKYLTIIVVVKIDYETT